MFSLAEVRLLVTPSIRKVPSIISLYDLFNVEIGMNYTKLVPRFNTNQVNA